MCRKTPPAISHLLAVEEEEEYNNNAAKDGERLPLGHNGVVVRGAVGGRASAVYDIKKGVMKMRRRHCLPVLDKCFVVRGTI